MSWSADAYGGSVRILAVLPWYDAHMSEQRFDAVAIGAGPGGYPEAEFAIKLGAIAKDLRLTIHPHPTLSEAMMDASSVSLGEAIHVINR